MSWTHLRINIIAQIKKYIKQEVPDKKIKQTYFVHAFMTGLHLWMSRCVGLLQQELL